MATLWEEGGEGEFLQRVICSHRSIMIVYKGIAGQVRSDAVVNTHLITSEQQISVVLRTYLYNASNQSTGLCSAPPQWCLP